MTGPQPTVYTHGHQEPVLRSHRSRTVANSAAYLRPELRPGQAVLDVGCGPGTITAELAELVGPTGRVVAVDTSAEVLESAARYAADRGLANVVFEIADVHGLPYADGEFDVVHAHQVLQHVADPVGALREMRRVTAVGGVVAARDVDYATMTWYPQVPELDRWLALYGRIARANGGEPDMRPTAAVLGPGGRLHRRHGDVQQLELCVARAACLVGRAVGGPDRGVRHRRRGGGRGVRGPGGAGADLGRVAGLGGRRGRVVRDAARRGAGAPRVSGGRPERAGGCAPRSGKVARPFPSP